MRSLRVVTDIDACRRLWKQQVPHNSISNVWEVRACFQKEYGHQPFFVVCEDYSGICGFLPLSWNAELNVYHVFPGETWAGKTWLEQNPLVAADDDVLQLMLSMVPGPYHLRYLAPSGNVGGSLQTVDEIGYCFEPARYEYSIDSYMASFSHKFAKRLRKEVDSFYQRGVEIRTNHPGDFELMIDMNIQRYGDQSYFYDHRFREGFRSLYELLRSNDRLRLVTVLVEGQPAAVDLGSMHNNIYTLLAGGTNAEFRGIAKLINLHHMEFACEQRFDSVDFLCGDFNWKTMFHLAPRPLYVLERDHAGRVPAAVVEIPPAVPITSIPLRRRKHHV